MRRALKLVVLLLSGVFTLPLYTFAEDGNAILKKVDEVSNAPRSVVARAKMILIDSDGGRKVREMKMWSKRVKKGNEEYTMRLIKFISPPEYRNVGFLSLSEDRMYIYLPEFGRVRRIASSARSERFLGSDLSYDDLASSSRSKHYTAKVVDEDGKVWKLECTRKPDSDKPYSKVELVVSKENYTVLESKMYDEGGELWKVMRAEYQKVKNYWVPKKIEVEDVKANHKTILEFLEIDVDMNLPKKLFSKRTLKKRVERIKP